MSAAAITCILPAYNEAPRIAAVLDAVAGHDLIGEVIVVDDGSSDGTAAIAESYAAQHDNVSLIVQPQNGGKTRAVVTGIEAAGGSHLMLIDTDLVGLGPEHLSALIAPVSDGRAHASISLRRNSPWPWRALGIDYISGERVMPRAVLADQLDALLALPRFGLEVFMNDLWLEAGFDIAVVRWPEVDSPLKSAKHGKLAGIAADVKMMRDIFRTIPAHHTLRQIFTMRARRI
ncbi:MAG: glycosyltransferase family 2 protein [Maritimibacter sp.]